MINWWRELVLTQQIFALFAVPATIVLVIQTVLLLIGLGTQSGDADGTDDTGVDTSEAPAEGQAADSGLSLITVRGFVAFFSIGGWTGIALIDLAVHPVLAASGALLAGLMALFLVGWLVRLALSLQSAGNLDVRNAVGLTGRVYLTIPGGGQQSGKVSLLLQERAVELDAFTEDVRALPTGSEVKIIGTRGRQLIVTALRPSGTKEDGESVPE